MEVLEVAESKRSSGYGKPPWIFKGSALYQLHLVKAETARMFIPKELRLVEAFGYTLGGFFLANYKDSPAGSFDELVVIAGIVWNPPTSCAWAARVLVSSDDACIHGRKDVGLPSHVAKFSKRIRAIPKQQKSKYNDFLHMMGWGSNSPAPSDCMDVQVTEVSDAAAVDSCNINLIAAVPEKKLHKWMEPTIKMSLPSFSGRTQYNPNLLKYSCNIQCRMRMAPPIRVSVAPCKAPDNIDEQLSHNQDCKDASEGEELSKSVLLSKPILTLEFSCLQMQVEPPVLLYSI